MRKLRRGDTGPAVTEVRRVLASLGLVEEQPADRFDEPMAHAVRVFQQSRGLSVTGTVNEETNRALEAARWQLGARMLAPSPTEPPVGEDVRALQERLLEMGYDVGRADGIYGIRTVRAVASFQREVGLVPDGACGPRTLEALQRLGRKVVGGRPQWLREADRLRRAGPALLGKRVVIDPGHGGTDPGVVVMERAGEVGGDFRWSESELTWDLAERLERRLTGAGVRVHLTRGPRLAMPMADRARAELANELSADLFISVHIDEHRSPAANGVASYHYGTPSGATSTVGERLAGLVQREIVVRTGLRDCRTHAKTWDLLRLTRMPAVRVDVGYLTSPVDRERLTNPRFRDTVADAVLAAVQRMYYPVESDVATGSIDVSELRTMLAATDVG
jgi:N-acetylmuramoyl-L-alanine amidase